MKLNLCSNVSMPTIAALQIAQRLEKSHLKTPRLNEGVEQVVKKKYVSEEINVIRQMTASRQVKSITECSLLYFVLTPVFQTIRNGRQKRPKVTFVNPNIPLCFIFQNY